MKFEIQQQKILHNVFSASGMVKHKEKYYVLGDDSPFLFKLNTHFEIEEKIPLFTHEHRERIPKHEKPDFEALEMISKNEMLGFGSGSLSPQRDKMIRIQISEEVISEVFSLSQFYLALKQLEIMKGSELNIEAAAFQDGKLYLFNRRKNVIFGVPYSGFIKFIKGEASLPEISASTYQLPEINGIEAGFSGATTTTSGRLIITSSVEDTYNAYDDGEVLGSFVGISSSVKNGIFESISWTRINSEEALKVESVIVEREISESEIDLLLVTDSDGEDSLIITGRLML